MPRTFRLMEFRPKRTFGIELEFSQGTNREALKHLISQAGEPAVISDFVRNTNNRKWYCKPDGSCGYEVASRVLGSRRDPEKVREDIQLLHRVVEIFKKAQVPLNNRCGFHVHICVEDLDNLEIYRLLAYWIKFEYFLANTLPHRRKNNSYCPFHSHYFRPNRRYNLKELLQEGFSRRGALNWSLYERRGTIEIRLAEGTRDPDVVVNWVRFLLHFIESSRKWPTPSNLNWLGFYDAMELLGFYNPPNRQPFWILPPDLIETREWILKRIQTHAGYRDAVHLKKTVRKFLQKLKVSPTLEEPDVKGKKKTRK